jgi:ACR3 family arsenite efflux pump ArsB
MKPIKLTKEQIVTIEDTFVLFLIFLWISCFVGGILFAIKTDSLDSTNPDYNGSVASTVLLFVLPPFILAITSLVLIQKYGLRSHKERATMKYSGTLDIIALITYLVSFIGAIGLAVKTEEVRNSSDYDNYVGGTIFMFLFPLFVYLAFIMIWTK